MPLAEDLRPCAVCGQPVLWGTRHPHCGQRVMEVEARVDALLRAIGVRMQEYEAAAHDPTNAESHRRRAKTKYGEAQAIRDLVCAAFGVAPVEAPSKLPMFAVGVAQRKWESLQADGYRMQRIHFARSVDGQERRGSIDPWGKVLWEPDGVAPSQAPSWWQVSYDHGKTWHDRATWPDPNKEVGLAMARVRHVSGVGAGFNLGSSGSNLEAADGADSVEGRKHG